MKVFRIYQGPKNQIEAVKLGWSWPGFFFGGFWMLSHVLFREILFIISIVVIAIILPEGILKMLFFIILFLIGYGGPFILGAFGNKLVVSNLTRHGYILIESINARNQEEALSVFSKESTVQNI